MARKEAEQEAVVADGDEGDDEDVSVMGVVIVIDVITPPTSQDLFFPSISA